MPKYIVEQYELHMTENEVEADSPAEAIKVLLGKPSLGNNRDDCSEFLEVAEQYGMSAVANQELVQQLRQIGVPIQDFVPSIRQVYRLREE